MKKCSRDCLLLERNDKGHNSKLPVHKLVTEKEGDCCFVREKEKSFIGSKADSDLIVRTKI